MARPPTRDFGKRGPVVPASAPPVKRSHHVALLLMGTVAIGGGAYALTSRQNCQPTSPGMAAPPAPQPNADCSRGSSSGGHGGTWSRHYFFGNSSPSSSSSTSSPSGTGSEAGAHSVSRGGFGSFAHSFAAHFSGGG
jgi:hypothetical protein